MSCDNIVGVKNILLTFTHCETGAVFSKVSHKLAGDELPKFMTSKKKNEDMTSGRFKQTEASPKADMTVLVEDGIPLSYYQGEAAIGMQVEMLSGRVYTGFGGGVVDAESSDTSEVTLGITFEDIDELVPTKNLVVT